MSLFSNLKTEGLEANEDRVGGFARPDTDVYSGTIKVAYAGKSDGGAQNVTLIVSLDGGQEHRETLYITNKKGENFYTKDGKQIALPGFTTVDDLCQVCADAPLADQAVEDKVVNVWDKDAKKEVPKSVPVITGLTGKAVLVAIQKSLVDKTEKNASTGAYEPTGEHREETTIEKVFHPELRVTVVEAKRAAASGDAPKAEFIGTWLERNKGKTRDKRQNKGGAGTAGRPNGAGGPPQAGANGGARKSLFGGASA